MLEVGISETWQIWIRLNGPLKGFLLRNKGVVGRMSNLSSYLDGISKELQQPSSVFNPFVFWDEPNEKLLAWNETIEEAIEEAVDRNHKGFNQSTQAFNDILKTFKDTDVRLRHVINNLAESRKLLSETSVKGGKTQIISDLWTRAQEYKSKLELYDKIEYFLEVPIIYEKYRNQCQYVHCSILLKDALQLWSEYLFEDIGLQSALADIKQFQNALKEELIEQINLNLYFKNDDLREYVLYRQKRFQVHKLCKIAYLRSCIFLLLYNFFLIVIIL